MKKFYLIFAMCITTSIFAQNSFPTENALWCINYKFQSTFTQKPDKKFCYGLIGYETINVNDIIYTYSKLHLLSDTILSEENSISYIGGFRNEGEKVWFRPYGILPDILLYDFGASIGDTVWHNTLAQYINNGEYDFFTFQDINNYSIISHIDDAISGRKKVTVVNEIMYIHDWIEGIGDVGDYSGFFGHILAIPDGDRYKPELECFKYNNVIVYPNQIPPNYLCNTCPCAGDVTIQSYDTENNSYLFQNQPNPFSKSTEIRYHISKDVNQACLLIFNIQGVLIKQIPVFEKGESTTIIYANELRAGTYIYQLVIDGKEVDSKKMILTKLKR